MTDHTPNNKVLIAILTEQQLSKALHDLVEVAKKCQKFAVRTASSEYFGTFVLLANPQGDSLFIAFDSYLGMSEGALEKVDKLFWSQSDASQFFSNVNALMKKHGRTI